jgi:peptidoglycan hydrolase-like protein with peptidoglycan-binding domain
MDDRAQRAQRLLVRLGYLAADQQPSELDEATRTALHRYQKLHELLLTSEPDDPTLASLEASDAAGECLLLGEVVDKAGPVAGVAISVRDRDLGPPDTWPVLVPAGQLSTDDNGRFEIRYSLDQVSPGDWPDRDKGYVPDLVFELSQQPVAHQGFDIIRLPATEPVSNDEQRLGIQARRLEEVRIVLSTSSRRRHAGDSEFEQLLADFTQTFGQRQPDALDEAQQEVSFVARELARPFNRVDALRLAFKISRTAFAFDVGPEIVYAVIRTRGITTVYGLASATKDDLVAALKQAIDEVIVGWIDEERIGRVVELILQLAPKKALDADGPGGNAAKFQQVVQHVLPDVEEQTELIRLFGQSGGDTVAFWKSLSQVPAFAVTGKIRSVQFALQLDRLTGSNLPLMAALQQGGLGIASTRGLLELGEQSLVDLMNQQDIAAPQGTAGATPQEQRQNHAAEIVGALHLAMPTESVAKILADAPHLIDTDQAVSGAVRQFMKLATSEERRNTDTAYDIRTTRLSEYLDRHGGTAFAGVDAATQTKSISHLQRAQRLFKLSTGPESFKALFASSLHSAHAVAQVSRQAFLEQWGEKIGKLDAMMVHSRAQTVSASALQVFVTLRDALSGIQPRAMEMRHSDASTPTPLVINAELRKAAEPLLKFIPNWQSLFGAQEVCDCKHCRSVLSPAAYLVDLLHFLNGRSKDGFTALDVLIGREKTATQAGKLGRRPDIAQLKLSCENTNTSLPYVDLVNEVLESLALAYVNAPLTVEVPIFDNKSVVAHDTGDATTAELQANPQYSIAGAYAPAAPTPRKAIDEAVFPPSLPYNQALATARVYLKHLGVELVDLAELLRPTPAASASVPWLAEALQLAPIEIGVLAGAASVDELYGLSPELLPQLRLDDRGPWVTALKRLLNIEGAGLTLAAQAVDEKFDGNCQAAVRAYQTAHGMPVTGEVKHLVWQTLLTLTPPLRSLVLPSVRELIHRLGIDYEQLITLLQLPSINPATPAFRVVTKTLALPDADVLGLVAAGFTAPSAALLAGLAAGHASESAFTTWARAHMTGANWNAFESTALLEVPETDPCNLELVRLRRWEKTKPTLDDSFWLRLAGFVRLSRRLGWTFAELDCVLRSLGALEISVEVLEQLAAIRKLQARLQFSLPELVELWAPPEVAITGSPYAKRFLSRAALRNDPAFTPDWKGDVLADADRPAADPVTIAAHSPALLAGFRLAATELDDILSDAGLTPTALLTQGVLVQITQRATLARAVGLKAAELGTFTALIRQGSAGPDLFQPPTRAWPLLQLVEAVESMRSIGLSATELAGIYLGSTKSPSAAEDLFGTVLPQLEQGFAQIVADSTLAAPVLASSAEFAVDPLLTQLSYVMDDSTTAQALLAALDGKSRQSVPLALAPAIPAPIDKRLSFQPADGAAGPITQATLNLRGRLSEAEVLILKALPTVVGFGEAVDQLARAADAPILTLLRRLQALGQLTPAAAADAIAKLLTVPSLDSAGAPDKTVATSKRAYLAVLLDPIVAQVRQRTVVKSVLSAALKLPPDVCARVLEPGQSGEPALLRCLRDPLAPMIDDFTAVASAAATATGPLKPSDLPDALAAFTRLFKAATLINAAGLSTLELAAMHGHWIDLNSLPSAATTDTSPFADALRLAAFVTLRANWRGSRLAPTAVLAASDLAAAAEVLTVGTSAVEADILAVVVNLGWSLAELKEPRNLLRLTRSLDAVKRLGVSAATAITWAQGPITAELADQIKRAAKAKYSDEAWLAIAPPLADAIRETSRSALVAYLLPRLHLQNSNQLYQTLLIDVETAPGALTSRVKQAISSVQLFIQRSLLNLEPDVPPGLIDRTQWEWMQRYRVWEANRKVFLYPHAFIRPELRDDKTPFFKELESELLQGELTNESCERALGHYLEKLRTVAKLEIGGMCVQRDFDPGELHKEVVHLFGRTANLPHKWFYRRQLVSRNDVVSWTPWEEVPLDIEVAHVSPTVWNRRLYLFWKILRVEPVNEKGDTQTKFHVAWSELVDGKWNSKHITPPDQALVVDLKGSDKYSFVFPMDRGPQTGGTMSEALDVVNGRRSLDGQFGYAVLSGGGGESFRPPGIPGVERPVELGYASSEVTIFPVVLLSMKGCNGKFSAIHARSAHKESYGHGFTLNLSGEKIKAHILGAFTLSTKEVDIILSTKAIELIEPDFFHPGTGYFYCFDEMLSLFGRVVIAPPRPFRHLNSADYASPTVPGLGTDPQITALKASGISTGYLKQLTEVAALGSDAWAGGSAGLALIPLAGVTDRPAPPPMPPALSREFGEYVVSGQLIAQLDLMEHPFVCQFGEALERNGLAGLLTPSTQALREGSAFLVSGRPVFNPAVVMKPFPERRVDFGEGESSLTLRSTPYSIFNWELFFHVPMLLSERLLQHNHFEAALRMLRYVFDPTSGEGGYWKFKPFTSARPETLEAFLSSIRRAASESLKQLAAWRDHPFQPHLLARLRVGEYMKFVVLRMIEVCIKAGDHYFRQDTIESIEIARLYYVMAADLLGPRPLKVPAPGQSVAKSFAELRDAGLDEFGNTWVALENELPFYNSASAAAVEEGGTVLGMTRSAYFGIPQDETLLAQWNMVEDRLFKIHHSMNIDGVSRQLPLFEPPIDPMLLVQATARGLDINSVINDLTTPMSCYRFSYALQRAVEACNEVKVLGGSLLSALEKKDGEALALLRSRHEAESLRQIKQVNQQRIEDARQQTRVLEAASRVEELRRDHYKNLLAIRETQFEIEQVRALDEVGAKETSAGVIDLIGTFVSLAPDFSFPPPPPKITFGGSQLAAVIFAMSRYIRSNASVLSTNASLYGIQGGFNRREQDWQLQTEIATKSIEHFQTQIVGSKLREAIADLELRNLDGQIERSQVIENFLLQGKFTNQDLYVWMESKIAEVYYQTYQLACELAKKAERAYRFELGLTHSDFIKFGSWDSQRKGLMAGEQLALQLRQMERAYHEANKREYEITKHVSLLSLDPMALIHLKEEGMAQFALPEALFDMDFPGHYMRRIKTVSITLPCVTGPYASVSATLRLTKSRIRYKPETATGYAPREDDPRFLTNYAATRAVATSTGQNDGGLFELNFRDERYLPFEGEGVESLWQLEINKDFAGFDIQTLSDAVLHIRYTAREGGEPLKAAAKTHLADQLKSAFTTLDGKPQPLTRVFSLRHEFPEAWNELTQPVPADATGEVTRVLTLPITKDRFPFFTMGRLVVATHVTVVIEPKSDALSPVLKVVVQDEPPRAGISLAITAPIRSYQVWTGGGTFAQISQQERVEWKLNLVLNANALRTVQWLQEVMISFEYTAK